VLGCVPAPVIDEDVDAGYWRARAGQAEALVAELRADKAKLTERVAELAWQVARLHDAYRYILQVLRMVMYFNPLKVLMPVALLLLGLGIAKGIFDTVVHPLRFAVNTVLIFVTGLLIASLALLADLIVRSRGDT
jgi:hypothetical protein